MGFYQGFLGLEDGDELDFAATGCIGAGADGASVNFGVHRGMMAQLRNEMPWLVAVHCVAHRLELAVKDSFKNSFFSEQVGVGPEIKFNLGLMLEHLIKHDSIMYYFNDKISSQMS